MTNGGWDRISDLSALFTTIWNQIGGGKLIHVEARSYKALTAGGDRADVSALRGAASVGNRSSP